MKLLLSRFVTNHAAGLAMLSVFGLGAMIALGTSPKHSITKTNSAASRFQSEGLACTASAVFSADFTNAEEASDQVKQQWVDFRQSLVAADYDTVTIKGTFDPVGLTINDSVVVPQIASTLQNSGDGTWTVSGVTFNVGHSGSSNIENPGTEINANTTGVTSTNSCPDPGWVVRPNLGNASWGGANTATCNGPSQTLTVTFSGSGAPSCASIPSNLVSWWNAEGNPNDSQDSDNGTLQGNTTFATGEVGQAFSFDASSNSGVIVPSSPSLNPTDAITIDAWVNPSSFPNTGPAVVRKDTNNVGTTQYSLSVGDGITAGVLSCNIGGFA